MKSPLNTIFVNAIKLVIIFIIAATIVSCGLIMHGTFQNIGINSTPSGAKVAIDNTDYGSTPVIAKLSRKTDHKIAIDLEGYEPYEITLTRKTDSWVLGNIIFGGLIGLAVDAISGSIYKLTPEQISTELKTQNRGAFMDTDNIYILLTLNPNKDWQEIGRLQVLRE